MSVLEGKRVLMVLAPENFRDEECFEPKHILEDAGAKVTIASRDKKTIMGMLGGTIDVDMEFDQIESGDYDAIVFIGGSGTRTYFNDKKALSLANEAYEKRKTLAAICIAPTILANAGILEGKKVTSFPSEKDTIERSGATHTGSDLEIDGNIITASGPKAARRFGEAIVESLEH